MTASTQNADRDDAHDEAAGRERRDENNDSRARHSEWGLTRMAACGRHHRRAVRVDEGARGSLAQRNLPNGRSYTNETRLEKQRKETE